MTTGMRTTSDKRILAVLHRMIIDGKLRPGDKISEVGVAAMLDVSRTPARLALQALEVEGLITKRQGRGFTVQEIRLDDISKAYEVRGVLEGLGAQVMAKQGMAEGTREVLLGAITAMDAALDAGAEMEETIERYQTANTIFHETVMNDCGNDYVRFAFARMESLPLLRLGTVVFDKEQGEGELMRLRLGNLQHRLIFDAIVKRDPQRAESLMREHANQTLVYADVLNQ